MLLKELHGFLECVVRAQRNQRVAFTRFEILAARNGKKYGFFDFFIREKRIERRYFRRIIGYMKMFFQKRGFGIEDIAYDDKTPYRRDILLCRKKLLLRGNELFECMPAGTGGVALRNDDGL